MIGDPDDKTPEEPRTVFAPRIAMPTTPAAPEAAPLPPAPPPPPASPSRRSGGIEIGDVLNHIYEVKRFIANGGMGQVYEGVNLHTEERVAIKVILPSLAADPNVQAMFRKEAKTLTRLSHPALVQYRVLAQEPQLGVLYIVTDYIDGPKLSDVLSSAPKDGPSLAGLLRRLAEGLRAGHELGAVHRDIAPDNVMLEDGQFARARIIDFGIVKDLDPSKGTVIGDGFAGKLKYVAPEQLGDFGRDMGGWTDVYSLALVLLAVVQGHDVDMGDTLVDAVDKRRAGVDVSEAPEMLRPVLAAMLAANPRDRLRSMDEVIAALDSLDRAPVQPTAIAPPKAPPLKRSEKASDEVGPRPLNRVAMISAAAAGVVALGVAAFFLWPDAGPVPDHAKPPVASPSQPLDQVARVAISATLPTIGCSWLDLEDLKADGGLTARFAGVAGDTAAAQGALSAATAVKGATLANIDFEDVAPIQSSACTVLDAFRAFKSPLAGNLTSDQKKYEKAMATAGDRAGESVAVPQIHISNAALKAEIVLIGIETDGSIQVLLPEKADLLRAASMNADGSATLKFEQDTEGWAGLLALSGKGPFPPNLVAPPPSDRGADWRAKLEQSAKTQGWKADMVWFKIVNEVPDAPASAAR